MLLGGGLARLHMRSVLVHKEGDKVERDRAFIFFFSFVLIYLG
jgi:hypothetical protein